MVATIGISAHPVEMTRRQLLATGGVLSLAATAVGCRPDPEDGGLKPGGSTTGEAPSLTELVDRGELPALEERLPEAPLVLEPVERVGLYGGTWRSALLGVSDTSWLGRTIGYEFLVGWDRAWTRVVPNAVESWEIEEGGREYVFHLRKGMRWSDGEPLTAADVIFTIDDVLKNTELYPAFPGELADGNSRAPSVESVNDYTVRFVFDTPAGLLLEQIADGSLEIRPRHYLEQFHHKYNAGAESLAEDENFPSWIQLFLAKDDLWANAERPRLHAWTITAPIGEGSRLVAERNPYYWKTDPDGQQLPYLDQVVYEVVSDDEVILLKATNGELDMHTRHINSLPNKPVLAQNRETGGYDFLALAPALENEIVIFLNLTHQDPALREIFQDKNFRIGLSHAIDRETLIDSVFQQQGEPWQVAPRPESEFYDEEFARQYIEYDPDRANGYLDRAGLNRRGSEGFRLRADGERLSFTVEIANPALVPYWVDAMELVVDNWKEVGVDARVRSEDRALFTERHTANEHDASVWTGFGGLTLDAILAPRGFVPIHEGGSRFAVPWAQWYASGGQSGEEPPEATRQQMELYQQLTATADEDTRKKLFRQILEIAKEQFYVIGTVMAVEGYGIVKNNLHNIPESMPDSHIYHTPAPSNPQQYFITD